MSDRHQRKLWGRRGRISRFFLLLFILPLSIGIGWIMAEGTNAIAFSQKLAQLSQTVADSFPSEIIGTVDPVPSRYQLGQQIYLENCATCHIALPPQVMPTQTWQELLQDSQHYGVQIPLLRDPSRQLLWNYLQVFSRPLYQGEQTPYRMARSRYFKALHPQVKLPRPLNFKSCATCHPQADSFNFRALASEWEN